MHGPRPGPMHLPLISKKGSCAMSANRHKRLRLTKAEKRETAWFYLLISPWLFGFFALTVYPMGASIYYTVWKCDVLYSAVQHVLLCADFRAGEHDNFIVFSMVTEPQCSRKANLPHAVLYSNACAGGGKRADFHVDSCTRRNLQPVFGASGHSRS